MCSYMQVPVEVKDIRFPVAGVTGSCELPKVGPELEYYVSLTTEPSLQPSFYFLLFTSFTIETLSC